MRIPKQNQGICLGVLALFCALGEVAAGEGAHNESALLKTEMEWPAFLARHDMLWTKLPQNWREAPWTGNGMLGSMSWVEGDALRLQVFRGDVQAGEGFGADHEGKIWLGRSTVKGSVGIAGPYRDVEIILQPDENTQKWGGQQAVDSFNPYKVGDKWYGFYGGHYHQPCGPWPVGLAVADKLNCPWKRMPEGSNPVPIVKTFIENPVVSQLSEGRYLAVFDSLGWCEIGYSISENSVTWPLETRLTIQTGTNQWVGNGGHDTRTPLRAVRENDGTLTVNYSAKMKDKGFWAVGKYTLGRE